MSRFLIKAQVAFEFVVLVSILFGALLVFITFVRDNFRDAESDTDYFVLKDIAMTVRSELNLASAMEDGYSRGFFIPLTIDGKEYNISMEGDLIFFATTDADYYISAPPFTGEIDRGNNYISKSEGVLEVHQ